LWRPLFGLLWLGFQSFERQRQALATLTAEKSAAALETRIHSAAEAAPDAIIRSYIFTIEHGRNPSSNTGALHCDSAGFLKAEREELDLNRPTSFGVAPQAFRR
jgi:hypothetical protein